MNQKQHKHLSAICQCGKVKIEAVGPPILAGSCYCTSCQEAGRRFEELASAPVFARSRQWIRLYPLSKGSSAMRDGA